MQTKAIPCEIRFDRTIWYSWSYNFPYVLLFFCPATAEFQIHQKPRFYGVKVGKTVGFTCSASDQTLGQGVVTWYKIDQYKKEKVEKGEMLEFKNSRSYKGSGNMMGQLFIKNVVVKDSGIYYCKMNKTWGHGTKLQVFSKCSFSWQTKKDA